ncbi:Os03g0399600 [Oryza sativa Japonica Group]|uniref:Os03g0399600 protein n=1 Tax=Oryza sativa subsp. japonica TaxID=39947 RepID=Q0DRB5_ORYSJ|nr:Os03g0399600 [Oryza sativa Japonica Group]|eukprot:NP_001050309.1 Os03g0399600 [Oryza sativa Japonica Group]
MALSLPARRSLALPAPRHHRCRPRFATVPAPRRRPSPLHRAAPPPAAVPHKSSPPSSAPPRRSPLRRRPRFAAVPTPRRRRPRLAASPPRRRPSTSSRP